MPAPKQTKADLQRRVMELESQLASRAAAASAELGKAGDVLMGSAVILHLVALGGREIVAPVAIRDGLSAETIAAIRADLRRSYDLATLHKPKE